MFICCMYAHVVLVLMCVIEDGNMIEGVIRGEERGG